ncbi:hypothetical protein BU15DRAFT_6869, partial [Melanogaster broomeanus]
PKPISVADGRTLNAIGRGDIVIELPNGKECTSITLRDVLYVPDIAFTLISTTRILKAGMRIVMD